jgi:hypothetical protein
MPLTAPGAAAERPSRALVTVGRLTGVLFKWMSRLRGAKAAHPVGAVYEAVLRVDGGAQVPPAASLLATPAEHRAVVRFSRSLGLPPRLPDLFGIAIRLPDVHGRGHHQDLLMVTSVDAPLLHHIFVPVVDPQQAPYSCSLPYRAGDERLLIGVQPVAASPRLPGRTVDERLERAAATGKLRFALAVAPLAGRFAPVGELRIGQRLPDEANGIRFNPWNTGGGLEPAGALNRLRAYGYPASQAGWHEPM